MLFFLYLAFMFKFLTLISLRNILGKEFNLEFSQGSRTWPIYMYILWESLLRLEADRKHHFQVTRISAHFLCFCLTQGALEFCLEWDAAGSLFADCPSFQEGGVSPSSVWVGPSEWKVIEVFSVLSQQCSVAFCEKLQDLKEVEREKTIDQHSRIKIGI